MNKKILKIKLISPKMSLRPMDSELKRRMSPSLSLVTVASLTPSPHHVYIEDENLHAINYKDSPNLVGITVNVDTAYRAFDIAAKYRQKGIKVVFGGIHASADPESMLEHCDAVCIGEAEYLWEKIINDHINHKLQKIYQNEIIPDLKKVPLPKWDLTRKNDYLYSNIISASRGCPFKCEFCYNSCDYVKNPYRNRPVSDIIQEIKRMNTRQVMFIDDNLIGNIKWLNEFMDHIENMHLIWHGAVSTNLVHYPELIKKMGASGCRSLFIGFESINGDSIKSANKKQNKIENYERLIKMLHENNIMVNASLVFGFDHDGPEIFPKTLDWLVKNKVETMTAHILTPYPGTKFHKRLIKENRIMNHDLSKYNTANVVFRPSKMSMGQLQKGYLRIYKDFYSIRNIMKRKPDNKKLLVSFLLFNFIYRKFGKFTSIFGKLGFMHRIGRLARKLSYGID